MKKINIVFEYEYEDCDIVLVPDFVADNVEKYSQEFLKWLSSEKATERYYTVDQKGNKCINCETDGFVEWLNKNICTQAEQAEILVQHVSFDKNYPVVDF